MRDRLVLLAAAAALLLSACARKPAVKAEPPRAVRLVAAGPRLLPRVVTAVGTLAAEERADVSFKVAGRLARLRVDIGSRAQAGDVLAELEPTDFRLGAERARAALEQARARLGLPAEGSNDDVRPEATATVRQAKAKLEQAEAELRRNKALLQEGLLSRSTFDVVDANYKVAESQYNDALEEANNRRGILAERRSSLAIAEQQLRDATLVAPFAGAVQQRRANVGEYLNAGTPVATLVKVNPIRMRLDVPEREAKAIRKGLDVAVRLEGDPKSWRGVVSRVSPALEEANRSLVVEAEIANPDGALRPGSFARAEIATDPGAPAVAVPASAVVVFAGLEKVITVKDGKAVEKPVVTGRRSGGLVEIVSGVGAGTRVVEKPGNLATGMPVVEEPAGGGAGDRTARVAVN
ncbi:MAG TPA: efflux RND transporter periplasmic adaptor subunit [Thermoanaerobaculia bacterium]|nr:efflux RND transporter periplasmic adaptor subunit [Thermoanaerobaculia bacterium]